MAFKMKSGNNPAFKMMGSSPMKQAQPPGTPPPGMTESEYNKVIGMNEAEFLAWSEAQKKIKGGKKSKYNKNVVNKKDDNKKSVDQSAGMGDEGQYTGGGYDEYIPQSQRKE